jgi:hypothetical protein
VFDQDDGPGESGDNTRDYVFKQDVEVHFTGKTTLDNGLTVGARIELEGQTSGDQIDEVWSFFSGGFGEVRFGDDDDALEQLCFEVPDASNVFGPDDPELNFSNSGVNGVTTTNETCREGDATRVIYFSPTFAGFSFAASFAPTIPKTRATRSTARGRASTTIPARTPNSSPSRSASSTTSMASALLSAAGEAGVSIARRTWPTSTSCRSTMPMRRSSSRTSPSAAPSATRRMSIR